METDTCDPREAITSDNKYSRYNTGVDGYQETRVRHEDAAVRITPALARDAPPQSDFGVSMGFGGLLCRKRGVGCIR